jgi:hypothetical protein
LASIQPQKAKTPKKGVFMKRILQLITLGCLALSSAYMIGDEPQQPERVELGKKPKKAKVKSAKAKSHAKQAKDAVVTKGVLNASYHPFYYIKAVGAGGGTISMGDETVWTVAPYSAYIADRWHEDMPIVIELNSWSHYRYRLKNWATFESVPVELALGPFKENCILITDINYYKDQVALSNGSFWRIGYKFWDQTSSFKNWQPGQAVLIGESDKWLSSPYILININENDYVHVNIG